MAGRVPKNLNSTEEKLFSYYEEKISFLDKLIELQKRQLQILGFGDGEGTAKLEIQNSDLVEKMKRLDRKIEQLEESSPQTLEIIRLSDTIFQKLEESRDLNSQVGEKMEIILQEYRKELNLVQSKIQLKKFLAHRKLGWKTGTC
ncbi:hypothetical protein CH352_11655 [Leptospira hartskeerlii]|uniref:Flagellar protein FlgN n=1 Tax=Leptospira hartskeerlii TaxID=2023177 RepID=A0A2M9XBX4_9LEPT|nr:hypothetical protein [Leptospira hartskeerlii]PJZ25205.1 hypothetical protein CH357_13460 [Leptospira hartskeerlii]PJZ33597.1 hypothetical protein CH352_11655 [Leptospira hartskeerlii]